MPTAATKSNSPEFIEPEQFGTLLKDDTPLLDVRAECEFSTGAIPGARNIPLLRDRERAAVGLCYRQQGQSSAIELGHRLVGGETKSGRVAEWQKFLGSARYPALYCARGGLRSEISQSWLLEAGVSVPRVRGGYKALRSFLIEIIESRPIEKRLVVLSGRTGCGKTRLLHKLASAGAQVLDLEQRAAHRGSAFGGELVKQPAQATFENNLAVDLLRMDAQTVFVEDESRTIGRLAIPAALFKVMQSAPLVVVECGFDRRVENIIDEYVVSLLGSFRRAGAEDPYFELQASLTSRLYCIRKRLGLERATRLSELIADAVDSHRESEDAGAHRNWIEPLLRQYYDPRYDYHLQRNAGRIIKAADVLELAGALAFAANQCEAEEAMSAALG